jgi:hypothetical protein
MTADRLGLYYPEMGFDSDWLKLGALYWPKVARIVPSGVRPRDDEDTRLLISELDFVLDVAPDAAAAAIAPTMLDLLRRHGEDLVRSYGFRPDEIRQIDWHEEGFAELRTARGVHTAKVDSRVRDALATLGLAHQAADLTPWLLLEYRLAEIYMCVLAQEVARQNPVLQPVTSFAGFYIAASGWTLERIAYALLAPGRYQEPQQDAGDVAGAIALLALELLVPIPEGGPSWSHVPVEKIIELRQRHGAEFTAFRLEVESVAAEVAAELSQVRDPAVLDAYLRHIADSRLVQPARELRKAMRGMHLDVASQAVTLKLEVPALATVVAGGAAAHQPLLAGGAAIAAGLVGLRLAARRGRAEITSPSAASYLAEAHTSLAPRTGLAAVLDGFRRVSASRMKHHDRPYLSGAL